MTNAIETVREVCAEMKDRDNLDGRDMCDNFHIEYGDYGGFDGLELIKAYADRILSAHEREMAAKDAEIARLKAELKDYPELKYQYEQSVIDGNRKTMEISDITLRIDLLERALKPVMYACTEDAKCDAVREAQRIMKEGENNDK